MSPSSKSSSPVASAGTAGSSSKSGHNDIVDSLGAALAGVNIGPQLQGNGLGFGTGNANNAFATGRQDDLGWPSSEFVDNSNFGSKSGRGEGLDYFLSQDPSTTLGDDVFKLGKSKLPNLGLADGEHRNGESIPLIFNAGNRMPHTMNTFSPAPPGVFGELRSGKDGRRESPISSVTGTTTSTSRSVSPHGGGGSANDLNGQRGIPSYYRYDNANTSTVSGDFLSRRTNSLEEDRYSSLPHTSGSSKPQTFDGLSPTHAYGRDGSHGLLKGLGNGSPYSKDFSFGGNQQTVEPQLPNTGHHVSGGAQQQQQILYMAVPSPDGRGQVLQPVQMLHVNGKPFTYVVPGSTGLQPLPPGGLQPMPQSDGSQGMRVLPPLNAQLSPDHHSSIMGRNAKNYGFDTGKQPDDMKTTMVTGVGKFNGMPAHDNPAIYATTQRPPLEALLGQVRRLSRDQVGCRLVQQALDEEGPMAATLILNEGLPFWSEAMVDPFGNYLFQKILEKITPEERIMLVKTVSSRLVNASLNLHGTRSVQKIVELCAIDEERMSANPASGASNEESAADILTRSLYPAAARLCIDSHGNHVIQRILLKLRQKHSKFVFDAVAASVGDVARHRHGCCVIQRCLDSLPSESRSHLVRRIVEKSLELMQDAYGNYVVQYVLDVCSDQDVQAVCESVIGKVNLLAIQKFSSNVMEKCLERCSDAVKEMYMQELSDTDRIRELMMDPFGNYVVQRALSVATHSQAIRLVEAMRPHLVAAQPGYPNGQRNGGVRNTAGGRRIMAKICRRFPNFTLSTVGTSQEELFSQNTNHHQRQQGHTLNTYAPMTGSRSAQVFAEHNAMPGAHLALDQRQQPGFLDGGSPGYYDHVHNIFPNM